jgi:proton-coupled amino acid transporter
VIENIFDTTLDESFKWWYAPICFAILFPLVLVRKIQAFAKFHVFGDVMVGLLVVVSITYATASVVNNGFTGGDYNTLMPEPELSWFNPKEWPNCIGFAVYSFEGIGVILPIQDITANKE